MALAQYFPLLSQLAQEATASLRSLPNTCSLTPFWGKVTTIHHDKQLWFLVLYTVHLAALPLNKPALQTGFG